MAGSSVDRWYQALLDEDCVRIMNLLKEDPSLLTIGWKSKESGEGTGCPWMGRSVFHVAARRGCVELIVRALKVFKFEDMVPEDERTDCVELFERVLRLYNFQDNFRILDEQRTSSSPKRVVVTAPPPDQSDQAHSEGDAENDQNSVDFSQDASDGEQQTIPESPQAGLNTSSANMLLQKAVTMRESSQTGHKTSSVDPGPPKTRLQKAVTMSRLVDRLKRRHTEKEQNPQKSAVPCTAAEHPLPVSSDKDHGGNLDKLGGKFSEDLFHILCSKDGLYKVDALALGFLSYNEDVIDVLLYAIKACKPNIFWIQQRRPLELFIEKQRDEMKESELRQVTERVIEEVKGSQPAFLSAYLEEYLKHPDFNFLSLHLYLLHFSFTSRSEQIHTATPGVRSVHEVYSEQLEDWPDLRAFVSEFQDGQGRPPIHVGADERGILLYNRYGVTARDGKVLLVRDGKRRVLHHRLEDKSKLHAYICTLGMLGDVFFRKHVCHISEDVSVDIFEDMAIAYPGTAHYADRHKLEVSILSRLNGFRGGGYDSDPVSAAIIHNENGSVSFYAGDTAFRERGIIPREILSSSRYTYNVDDSKTERSVDKAEETALVYDQEDGTWTSKFGDTELSHLQLACLAGNNLERVREMLNCGYEINYSNIGWETLHMAAASGNYKMLKTLIDNSHCDSFIEDSEGNNALHYALGEPMTEIRSHLLDYVSCQQLLAKDDRQEVEKNILDETILAERKGCVNLLLQAGCDVFKVNKMEKGPYPQGRLGNNGEFLSWWYDVQTKEFAASQNNLNIAANAISITATLVATASYVGPLQPPMGYDDANHIQYQNGWVATFVFCDTLSFYLAIAAIILSLIPSLPVPQQPMTDELRRTRRMITLAVGVLFPSIICVLIAFASSSMAVVSAKIIISSLGGKLTIASMFIGAPSILVAFVLFFIRLLGIWFPKNSFIKYMHKLTSF